MDMKGRDIEIQVERIDLAAMPGDGERRLRDAVVRELARIAGEAGVGAHWAGPGRARAGASPNGASPASESVAASIGGQVRAGLSRESGR
jgi:hypothetical protein